MLRSSSYLFTLVLCISLFWACAPQGALVIHGEIEDASNLNVYFDKITATGSTRVLTNAQANSSGNFDIVFEEPLESGIYRARVGAKSAYLMLTPDDKVVNLKGSISSFGDNTYEVTGSNTSSKLQESLTQIGNARTSGLNLDQFILTGDNPFINAFLAQKAYDGNLAKTQVFKGITSQLENAYPNSEFTKDFKNQTAAMEQQLAAQSRGKYKVKVGDPAPEIVGFDPDGKERKLSDLTGKVVLLDFWASWCGPCRKANPHVVEVYDKYKAQGFDVFSYSLDGVNPRALASYNNDQERINKAKEQAEARWIAAIKKDNLKWASHATELGHWNSKGNKDYGVSSIPTTFLIARDGTIAAVNPRYNLEEAVKAAL